MSIWRNTQYLEFRVSTTCSAGATGYPLYFNTTTPTVGIGNSYVLQLEGAASPMSFGTPSTYANIGLLPDIAGKRLYKSDTTKWVEVGAGRHPVTEGPTYFYVSDRTPSNVAAWAVAPRVGGASLTFATAGTLTSGTGVFSTPFTSYQTPLAVIGSQGHHSTSAVFVGPASRWSGRVGFGSVTSVRAFFGLSSVLPLTAGSSTPTADAAVFRLDTSISPNFYACVSDGTVGLSCTDTTVGAQVGSEDQHTLEVDCRESTTIGVPTACTFWVDGRPRARLTTLLPNNVVGSTISVETLAAAFKSFFFSTVSIEPAVRVTP